MKTFPLRRPLIKFGFTLTYLNDLVNDPSFLNCDLICLTETQIDENTDTTDLKNSLSDNFEINFNNCAPNRFHNTALCYNVNIEVLEFFQVPGLSLFHLKKA